MKDAVVGLLAVLLIFVIVVLLLPLQAWILVWAWNFIMPTLFQLPVINFWHAIALIVLRYIFIPSGIVKK